MVSAHTFLLLSLALLTSRIYGCDILRSLRALPLTTGRKAWAWHNSLRSNMYHAFPAHCSVAHCVAPRCPLYNEITHARHNANKFAFYSHLIVINNEKEPHSGEKCSSLFRVNAFTRRGVGFRKWTHTIKIYYYEKHTYRTRAGVGMFFFKR